MDCSENPFCSSPGQKDSSKRFPLSNVTILINQILAIFRKQVFVAFFVGFLHSQKKFRHRHLIICNHPPTPFKGGLPGICIYSKPILTYCIQKEHITFFDDATSPPLKGAGG